MGTTTAIPICYALRDQKILSKIANIEIDEIQNPTPLQISNYLNNTLKPTVEGKTTFNYGELFACVKNKSVVPVDEHKPFVLAYFFEINDRLPSASIFKFSFTTKFLLQLAKLTKQIKSNQTI